MSTDPMPGGRRRIDRVLDEHFLDRIREAAITELRGRRKDAEQEEADLSYVRRMLQGRADLIRDELGRRSAGNTETAASHLRDHGDQELVHHLTEVLADTGRTDHGSGRFLSVEPSRVDEHRRAVERLIADVGLSDLAGSSDEQLRTGLAKVEAYEHEVSTNRRRVQQAMDACTAEIARRYKEGEARVDDLLADR